MCGIFGMISRKPKPFNKRAFCTMGVRNDSRGGDSCGVFIDGNVEYGVDKEKFFIDFFRKSLLLDATTECKIALGHCRKASVGKVSAETAQPVVLRNEAGEVEYVLIHNGTIYNYKELAAKYIPDVKIDGLTDSQVMARIFYYKGYEALSEYNGGAVFVIHDYRIDKTLAFKGSSKKYTYSVKEEEERPLYYCWHNGRFIFSSIFETLYAFYYEEVVYDFPCNKLVSIKGNKVKLVQDVDRSKATQCKPVQTVYVRDADDEIFYGSRYGGCYVNKESESYKVTFDGTNYLDKDKKPLHGVYIVSSYGYLFPNKKNEDSWLNKVAFFQGQLLKHPDAFELINKEYLAANKQVTKEVQLYINLMNFNPFTEDEVQYYWYEDEVLNIPQGEWKFPMADYSCQFDSEGILVSIGKAAYYGWTTDYKMYTFDKNKIEETYKELRKTC